MTLNNQTNDARARKLMTVNDSQQKFLEELNKISPVQCDNLVKFCCCRNKSRQWSICVILIFCINTK